MAFMLLLFSAGLFCWQVIFFFSSSFFLLKFLWRLSLLWEVVVRNEDCMLRIWVSAGLLMFTTQPLHPNHTQWKATMARRCPRRVTGTSTRENLHEAISLTRNTGVKAHEKLPASTSYIMPTAFCRFCCFLKRFLVHLYSVVLLLANGWHNIHNPQKRGMMLW